MHRVVHASHNSSQLYPLIGKLTANAKGSEVRNQEYEYADSKNNC